MSLVRTIVIHFHAGHCASQQPNLGAVVWSTDVENLSFTCSRSVGRAGFTELRWNVSTDVMWLWCGFILWHVFIMLMISFYLLTWQTVVSSVTLLHWLLLLYFLMECCSHILCREITLFSDDAVLTRVTLLVCALWKNGRLDRDVIWPSVSRGPYERCIR